MATGGSATAPLYRCGQPRKQFAEPLRIVLLGATGSIGGQTVDLVLHYPDRLRLVAVTAHRSVEQLRSVIDTLHRVCPDQPLPAVAVTEPRAHEQACADEVLRDLLLPGADTGLIDAVRQPPAVDCVVNALVGAVGLAPTLAAAGRGVRIALANKESLVVGGELVRAAVAAGDAELLPVDSEHSAIAQCLVGRQASEIANLILTASGGPFRDWPASALADVSLEQVLNHPTWDMGPKITVDSATLMNKGLEVIEAHHLFGLPYDQIEVVVHPGSYVHSLVEFRDGALLAQLGSPDMRVPLLYAISGEMRWPLATERLDLVQAGKLEFAAPDPERFPCLRLAREAGREGGRMPIVLNGANEVAVAALLERRIGYLDIPAVIEQTLATSDGGPVHDLEHALAVDREARAVARTFAGSS